MASENVKINIPQEYTLLSPPRYDNITEMSKEGAPRLCPLCNSPIRLFYINFNDKFLMCENTQCEYPFGHEDLKIVKHGDELSDDETSSLISKNFAASISSTKTWTEVERLNQELERSASVEDMHSDESYPSTQLSKHKLHPKEDEKIMKSVEDIIEMHEELNLLNQESNKNEEETSQIRNKKWIKNLKNLQEMSGVQLLRPEEMGLLKKEEPAIGLGELKIDIGPACVSNMSSIRIEIHNTGKCSEMSVEAPVIPDELM